MSIHRHAAKRDGNEGAIRKRFAHHGWHTEQVSAAGMPDLIAWSVLRMNVRLVDVKDGNGQPTPAQVKKWTALRALGIPVYVVRTEDDVDAMVNGKHAQWHMSLQRPSTVKGKRKPAANYRPPRSAPVDAATEAEVFAPPQRECVGPHTNECITKEAS